MTRSWLVVGVALMLCAAGSAPTAHAETSGARTTTVQQTAEQRIGGADRYGTAANVARWLPVGDGHLVVVATGETFPDALSVGPLAAREQSRLLLTRGGSVPDDMRQELLRNVPQEIIIVGGPGAVSEGVAAELGGIAPVRRIGGIDRYATSADVAAGMTAENVVIASGEGFADSLSAGPLAAKLGGPLLLTRAKDLPPATATALGDLHPVTVTVVGGPGAISDGVLRQIEDASGATVVRIGGLDRYDTAAKVASTHFGDADTALVASGTVFPDGLSGTPLAGAYRAPILLSGGACAPTYTASALAAQAPAHVVYLGGPSAVTSSPIPCGTSAIRPAINPPTASVPSELPVGTPTEEAIYFVPHQDDELISMAGGLNHDINAGRRVHVYLMFAGYWTSVKDRLCTQYNRCLTNEEITASRNAELLASVERLGVPASNVHFLYIPEEASDTDALSRSAMALIAQKAGPSARFRTMSWLDGHPNHFRLGYALRDTCNAAGVDDCLFFQSPLYQQRPEAMQYRPVVTPQGAVMGAFAPRVSFAAAAYKEDHPLLGRHSVGWRSVPDQITWVERHTYSWAHGQQWASEADEAAAAKWIDQYQSPYSPDTSRRMPAPPFEEHLD